MVSEDESVDGDLESEAFEECLSILVPYLKKGVDKESFKDKLEDLGVKTLSHIDLIEHCDVAEFISVISFREVQKKRKAEQQHSGNVAFEIDRFTTSFHVSLTFIIPYFS